MNGKLMYGTVASIEIQFTTNKVHILVHHYTMNPRMSSYNVYVNICLIAIMAQFLHDLIKISVDKKLLKT